MNKTEKLLRKLDNKTRLMLERVISRLIAGSTEGLDIKKLKGTKDTYRVRIGSYRIIFKNRGGKINFMAVAKRDDKTYKDY